MERRFYARKKARAQKDSVGAKRQSSRKAPAIGKSAGRENRNRRNRIDNHRNERHAGHPADMTAPLGALCNDDISAGLCCADCFRYGSGHVGDLAASAMGPIEVTCQVLLRSRPCELHHARSEFEGCSEAVLTHVEHQEVQTERLVGFLADSRCALSDLLRRQIVAPQSAEAARSRNSRHKRGRGGRTHATKCDWMLNIEQVADGGTNHEIRPTIRLPRMQ